LSQDDNIAFFEVLADFWYFAVNQHIAFFNDAFNMRAGNGRVALRQKNIQPLPDWLLSIVKLIFSDCSISALHASETWDSLKSLFFSFRKGRLILWMPFFNGNFHFTSPLLI
jgi:hypothetical protein